MSAPLPARPSLEWLRKRAKARLKQIRVTRPAARLAEVQLALARESGYASWRALVAGISTAPPLDETAVAEFLRLVGTGEVDAVRRMLDGNTALVNAVGPHPFWGGRPQALHVAIEAGRQPMINLLFRAGADVNGSNAEYDGWSPLMLAMDRKRDSVARTLIRRGARVGLVEALMRGDDRTVLRLLKPGRSALAARSPSQGSLLMFARTPKAIDRLLELGVSPTATDRWGASPIEALSRMGKGGALLVRHLIRRGVAASPAEFARLGDRKELERIGRQDPAALRDPQVIRGAVDFRHHALVEWLLGQGADPNARAGGQADPTPLHSAAWNGDLRMVKLLMARGADRSLLDRQYSGTPLGWAQTAIEVTANPRCKGVVRYLEGLDGRVTDPSDRPLSRKEWKPLMDAVFAADVSKVKRLLASGADPNMLSNSTFRHRPLHRAIEPKKTIPKTPAHLEIVRLLLAAGADPRRRGLMSNSTALELAASGEVEFVPLVQASFGALDIFHAAITLSEDRVRSLLREDPSLARAVDANGLSPLHSVASSAIFKLGPVHLERQLRIARLLLELGADPSATFPFNGEWPIPVLYFAAGQHDNPALTELLLAAGANPMDGEGIWHASDEGHMGSLAVFERMVPKDILGLEASRCLVAQLRFGRSRGMPWLLAHGADPNYIAESSGDAPLHAAARSRVGQPTIDFLIRHGADPKLRNREGKTAAELRARA
jgi:ankyrin repeat protein